MSTYPGDTPQPPDGQRSDDHDSGTEPTQPVGYWERQEAERAREQSGPVFNPTSSQSPPSDPAPPGPQNPYGEPPAVNPYGPSTPPPYGGQAAGGYPPPSGHQPYYPPGQQPYDYGYSAARPDHPRSTLSLVLGLVGLVGGLTFCGLPLVVSPFAWVLGHHALKDIKASQGQVGGEGQARAGMIMGIIGTVLAVLAIIGVILLIVLVVVADTTSTTGGSSV
jgi:hypothetical protein